MISRYKHLAMFVIISLAVLIGLFFWFLSRKPFSPKYLTFSFVDFQAQKSGITTTQLQAIDQMALVATTGRVLVRDMETNRLIPIQRIIFSETLSLTKPYYEPLIDQHKKVMYALMQRCQMNTCWVDLYRDPIVTTSEKASSFITMYANALYALTHERNAQELDHFHALTAYQTAL